MPLHKEPACFSIIHCDNMLKDPDADQDIVIKKLY